jgi:hypothetical protein
MSDEPGRPATQWNVFTPGASLVRSATIGGAVIGFVLSTVGMATAAIIDAQPLSVFQLAFMAVLIAGGTLQVAGVGFCVGYVVARLKHKKAQNADSDESAG